MALDGVLLNCIMEELKDKIVGGRIDKIHQPEKDEIYMGIRANNQNLKLLISASSNYPRIHLTNIQKGNPLTPPVFCMVLRKHLIGGRIINIEQPNFERILILYIESRDELGDLSTKRLIVEIMGRHSNIILVDNNDVIIDSVKRITEEISRVRQVLPGRPYVFPPSQNKQNPLIQGSVSLDKILNTDDVKKAARTIQNSFTGISRVTAQEIVYRGEIDSLPKAFLEFFERVNSKNFEPVLLKDEAGRPIDIFPFPYHQYDLKLQQPYESVSMALELFFHTRDKMDRIRQHTAHLHKVLNSNLERAQKKLGILVDEYQDAQNAEKYRLYGELITTNIYQIPKGVEKIELVNYYDPNGDLIEIPLDKNKTPNQNAQTYFKKYNKAKNALVMIEKQIKETQEEIQYLDTQLDNLNKCTEESEIDEIRQELAQEGYIRLRSERKKSKKLAPSKPYHFLSSDGFHIYVGKNNTQNDRLTLKTAEPEDLWLHTKDIPGSHVIVKAQGKELPRQTLLEAGILAAYFSKAKNSTKVPVDYCPRKNVRKPSGAKPGMIIYENYHTMYVTPDETVINNLKKMN